MNRYGWMLFRAYLPALVALAVALGAMVWTSLLGSMEPARHLVLFSKWIPPIALLVALASGGVATLRMWRWQRGETPACAGCGGALGRVQHASAGDYRKCLCCGGRQMTDA